MTTVIRNKSKSRSKKTRESIDTDEKIDQIMKDITLKRPRNSYTQFVLAELDSYKTKNKDAKIDMPEFSQSCAEKWKKLKDGEKKKYSKLYEDEKVKFKNDIELVRHYLFRDFNDNVFRSPTAYRIFLNEKLREGFEQGLDPKDVRKDAGNAWAKMTEDEKKVYIDKKKENDNWFLKAEKIRKINPISLFIQKKIEEAKEKHKEPPALKEIAPAWKKLSKNEKKSYEKYAQEINEEKEQLKDIYDIVHGIKPKKPAGAYRIFLQEKAKNNEIKSIKEGHEMWKKLTEDQKEEYLTKSHKCLLAYRYKKMIYNKKIKKMLPKKPIGPFQQFLKEKKGQKPANGESYFSFWKTVFEGLSESQKKKYVEKAEKSKEKYDKKMIHFQDKVFDMPKKPVSGFALYVAERMPDLKKEKPDLQLNQLMKQAAKEWNDGKDVDQKEYNKNAEKDRKRFKKQLKEFQKLGYYTKDKSQNDADEDKSKKSKKKKSSSKASTHNTKSKKSKKSKSQRSRSKSRKKEKSENVSNTKKSKK
jgi:hypothetical protein